MKTPVWWTQLWCPHNNMIKGINATTKEPWTQCLTCGRRTGADRAAEPVKKKQPHWAPPNFPPGS